MSGIEEAIILAAGRGTRLGGTAAGLPKCLVDVAGRSILDRQLDALASCAVRRVVVVLGHEAERVEAALATWRAQFDIATVVNPAYATTNVLASWALGAAVLRHNHFYLHGDTVFEPALLQELAQTDDAAPVVLTVARHTCAEEEMKVRLNGPRVAAISKEIPIPLCDGEFTGIMAVSSEVMPLLRQRAGTLLAGEGGERLFMESILNQLVAEGTLAVGWLDITGMRWREIDFPGDLAAARALFAPSGRP